MRVLIWAPFVNPGGGQRLLQRLVEGLTACPAIEKLGLAVARRSFEQTNFQHGNAAKVRLVEVPDVQRRTWTRLAFAPKVRAVVRSWSHRRNRRRLENFLRKIAPGFDLLYCFWAQHEPFVHSTLPQVATIQDLTLIEFPEILGEDMTTLVRSEIEKWMHHSSCVVSSNAMRQKVKSLFPDMATDLHVVRHATSPEPDRKSVSSAKTKQLPERYLLWPSNLNVHKNHHNLFIAFQRWGRRAEIPLILIGEGTDLLVSNHCIEDRQLAALRSLLKRLELRKNADFFALGYVADGELSALIRQAWCLVMPSLAEGGGSFPVEEALSYGVPVACSDIPVMREHLSERTAKIAWFDPYCPSSIAAALNEIDLNYDLYKQSATAGAADPRPSWESIAAQYAAIFENALAGTQNK